MSNNGKRVAFAAVAIPVALGVVYYGGFPLALLVAVVAVLGTRELFDLAAHTGVRPLRGVGMTLAALAPLTTWLLAAEPTGGVLDQLGHFPLWLLSQWPLAAALAPVLILSAVLWKRHPGDRPLGAATATLFGPIYCGVLPSALLVIRYASGPDRSWPAAWVVFFPLVVTWLCDSFAMWGGKLIGGPKMAPVVSPGKTRSGGLAGMVGGTVAALVYVPLVLGPAGHGFSLAVAGFMGIVLSATAQAGDLAESLLKREANVKDSSGLIPGHGGVLDRFDSLYFVLPVAALLYRAFGVI